jgi:hypothetical protein
MTLRFTTIDRHATLAPMPLFAACGLLTALMIVMALVATLAVLPSVLVLVTSDRPDESATVVADTSEPSLV